MHFSCFCCLKSSSDMVSLGRGICLWFCSSSLQHSKRDVWVKFLNSTTFNTLKKFWFKLKKKLCKSILTIWQCIKKKEIFYNLVSVFFVLLIHFYILLKSTSAYLSDEFFKNNKENSVLWLIALLYSDGIYLIMQSSISPVLLFE